ncbi:site-2 protease family protein [Hydrogenophilus thermoluteolus]|mgnify:FL=1|jgi:Zn-dependent protease|uniref:Peptidase M50 n=2 Tax=Hydrogenophilus thermoluteolus TaxID=297 RepID=A0A2Z6DYA3_HYDTE|nr:site-2 protease family protein [Hydrogenophilus thermoluteolus]HCO77498.1 site-2 protease family protein [Rhodocyclaceae bacterium]MBW7657468.1 site-2 protease family protein [Hydrogenophilus thermoluteolus]BBD77292.1 peptidase M50 [Hydrogenophilus thermoluteolus]GLW61343.1 peptidase M50 [Hydrogenophilus thermoluteolus]HNQ48568.1 site-2 protease family protein [Hydrogenophilus thermoluteolus]
MAELIATLAIWAIPVLLAITLHEAAHGYVARAFGDRTAERLGRITLNPIKHIDPVGTVAVPVGILTLSTLFGGPAMLFGWAKPVPVDPRFLRRPKQDMFWVAGAGPMINLAQALVWALLFKVAFLFGPGGSWLALARMSDAGIHINLILALVNLLPIPPLDGGRMLVAALPYRLASWVARLEPYGMVIVLLLLFSGGLSMILWPLYALFRQFFLSLVGIGV